MWVAVNRGMNGTLVNGSRIEGPRTLAPGDKIQIGAETVLEFQVAAAEPKKKRKERKKKDATGTKKPLWENPVVIGGASVYLLLTLAFFVWVGGRSSSDGKNDLDRQMVEAVSAKTRAPDSRRGHLSLPPVYVIWLASRIGISTAYRINPMTLARITMSAGSNSARNRGAN